MVAPLEGIRVVEVANWLAAPAAAALLADMGAEVIKIEPPGGDPYRHLLLQSKGFTKEFERNFAFDLDNRGKRSIAIDLERDAGVELVQLIAANCDIFITNLLPARARKYGLDFDSLKSLSPSVVYAWLTGYGSTGPEADRAGFDFAAFWARTGIMGLLGEPDAPPPLCRGGQGDHTTALNLLAAVLAALRVRDRTGEPQLVEVTLQATGMWTIAGDVAGSLVARENPTRISRAAPVNPIWNSYRCKDDRWILLVNPSPFPNAWPAFCRMIDRPDWAQDSRFASVVGLRAHASELVRELDELFATRTLAEWGNELDRFGIIWAPVAELTEVVSDPQARHMGWFTTIEDEDGPFETLAAPFKLHGADVRVRRRAPRIGEHAFEILQEIGVTESEIEKYATAGVFG